MGSPTDKELELLCQYAKDKRFMIETGRGKSTLALAKIAEETDALFCSIDITKYSGVSFFGYIFTGWSISYEDLIRYKPSAESIYKNCPEIDIIKNGKSKMIGDNDWIRKILNDKELGFSNKKLDFFFCDTGEYCGWAEFNITKDEIVKNGIFACHDIYFPKSIKSYMTLEYIKKYKNEWKILECTNSVQGLLIARKLV